MILKRLHEREPLGCLLVCVCNVFLCPVGVLHELGPPQQLAQRLSQRPDLARQSFGNPQVLPVGPLQHLASRLGLRLQCRHVVHSTTLMLYFNATVSSRKICFDRIGMMCLIFPLLLQTISAMMALPS